MPRRWPRNNVATESVPARMPTLRLLLLPPMLLAASVIGASPLAAPPPAHREHASVAAKAVAFQQRPNQHQQSDGKLICAPEDPNDCYSQVFVPTESFRPVRLGQSIPPGLHVRLNMQTGLREAKLRDPDDGDQQKYQAVELGTGRGESLGGGELVVVPSEAEEFKREENKDQKVVAAEEVDQGMEDDESAGFVRMHAGAGDDFQRFMAAKTALRTAYAGGARAAGKKAKKQEEQLSGALDTLTELAHDLHFGLRLADDEAAVRALLCGMAGMGQKDDTSYMDIQRKAATALAAAVQNNPAALERVAVTWEGAANKGLVCSRGDSPSHSSPMHGNDEGGFLGALVTRIGRTDDAQTARAKVVAFHGLLKHPAVRRDFLGLGGMRRLAQILVARPLGVSVQDWDAVRTKVAHLVLDNFLDVDMGAVLGAWPPPPSPRVLSSSSSSSSSPKAGSELASERLLACDGADRYDDGCWVHHIVKEAARHAKDEEHWSWNMYAKLTGKEFGDEPSHPEL